MAHVHRSLPSQWKARWPYLWKESASVSGWATTFTVWTRGGCCGICTFTSIHNSRVIISYQAPWPWFSYNLSIELEQNLALSSETLRFHPCSSITYANNCKHSGIRPFLAGVIQVMAEPRSGSQGPSCRLCCSGGEPHRGTSALSACHLQVVRTNCLGQQSTSPKSADLPWWSMVYHEMFIHFHHEMCKIRGIPQLIISHSHHFGIPDIPIRLPGSGSGLSNGAIPSAMTLLTLPDHQFHNHFHHEIRWNRQIWSIYPMTSHDGSSQNRLKIVSNSHLGHPCAGGM